ncbi:MAG TPA: hypothetical protein PK251_16050 [Candidatus Latescibacteria bacterium]|nr:hypothetical protein [Candidatus Latescibacterota bacterium]HRT28816.1 hypothetical protein [Kiritimatiellia bacterium]
MALDYRHGTTKGQVFDALCYFHTLKGVEITATFDKYAEMHPLAPSNHINTLDFKGSSRSTRQHAAPLRCLISEPCYFHILKGVAVAAPFDKYTKMHPHAPDDHTNTPILKAHLDQRDNTPHHYGTLCLIHTYFHTLKGVAVVTHSAVYPKKSS